jgi:hypothetical protein
VNTYSRILFAVFVVSVLLIPAKRASAQAAISNISDVTLNASMPETLTVTTGGVSIVNFTLVPGGVAAGDAAVPITTSWVLKPNRGPLTLLAYFDTTDALTEATDPGTHIVVGDVLGRVSTGTPTIFTAFTGGAVSGIGTAGASLELFSVGITGANKNDSWTGNLELEIDLTSALQQPAGSYTGTLHIQAVAP